MVQTGCLASLRSSRPPSSPVVSLSPSDAVRQLNPAELRLRYQLAADSLSAAIAALLRSLAPLLPCSPAHTLALHLLSVIDRTLCRHLERSSDSPLEIRNSLIPQTVHIHLEDQRLSHPPADRSHNSN